MQTLEKIAAEMKQLPKAEQAAARDWLEHRLEDAGEFTDAFTAKIESTKRNIREGNYRINHP